METWHPLGVVGVITRLQLPRRGVVVEHRARAGLRRPGRLEAVRAGAAVGARLPALLARAIAEAGVAGRLSQVVIGGAEVGEALVDAPGIALLSATGSTRMGRAVGPRVADRFGRSLLELGGNNAAIVTPSADLDLTARGIVFSAAGTAGQRCTTMRRVIAHELGRSTRSTAVAAAYERLPIGDPLADGTLVGPLVNERGLHGDAGGARAGAQEGGKLVVGGGRVLEDEAAARFYVEPAVVRMPRRPTSCARRPSRRSST